MEGGPAPFKPDRPRDVLDGDLVLARLVSDHAEKMPRIGMIRLDRENLPVDLLGGMQPAGLMVLDRDRQCFGNGCHDGKPWRLSQAANPGKPGHRRRRKQVKAK